MFIVSFCSMNFEGYVKVKILWFLSKFFFCVGNWWFILNLIEVEYRGL